jgi:hypothetical protein
MNGISELDIIRSELLLEYQHDITALEIFTHIRYNLKAKMYDITFSML